MALDEFRSVVDQNPALQRVVLHGVGEPLLNRELARMVAHLKGRAEAPQVLFNSNAILLTPEKQEALIRADLDEFRVSTDAAHRELYADIRGVDGFEQMAANVKAFAERIKGAGRGPRLSLWFTAMHENLGDLEGLVRLAHHLGVGEVHVQRLVFYGQGLAVEEQSLYQAMKAEEDVLLNRAEAVAEELGVALSASGATSPRNSLLPGEREGQPWSRCRRPLALMYITANGNVLPCCFSPFTTRDYQGLILGNTFQDSLDAIWNGAAYQQFRAALQSDSPPESCDRCGVYWSL
jgi:radical SAM protein with 4Fe4S-binding SPASM domain